MSWKFVILGMIALLFFSSSVCAEEEKGYGCDFDFKEYEADIFKQIPSSMILSRKSDGKNGKIQLKIGKSQEVTVTYRGCFHLGISIKASHMDKAYLEKFLEFTQILVGHAAFGMPGILKSLRSHIADEILSLEIRDYFFSTMYIDTIHNEDGTMSIEISASGG